MCTLLIAHRRWNDCPLLVAANRDERLARLAAPPVLRSVHGVPILAPTDLALGGTWMGANPSGLFVGITNRFGVTPDPSRRSRGEVVLEALRADGPRQAVARVQALDVATYNPFHLVVASVEQAMVLVSDGVSGQVEPLAAGWHVITERSYGAGPTTRPERLMEVVLGWGEDPPDRAALEGLLSHHSEPSIEGVCVHWGARSYGTRSSAVLRFGGRGELEAWRYTEGPPCEGGWTDLPADALAFRGA